MDEAASDSTVGNSKEDWKIFEVLMEHLPLEEMETSEHDVTTALRSELAGLQYKRDRLTAELTEMQSSLRARDQRVLDLQMEADQLREQTIRQNAIISSLKKKVQDLEEHERDLHAAQGHAEITMQSLQRENRYCEDKVRELEKKLRNLELECSGEEQQKEAARTQIHDLLRRFASALGVDYCDAIPHPTSPEVLLHKATELVQETSRLRTRASTLNDSLAGAELELRNARDALERAQTDREALQRQGGTQLSELERLRADKEALEMRQRVADRELAEMREKCAAATRSLGSATGNVAQQESMICQLRDELKVKEEKNQRLHNELRHLLESLAIQLSSPSRYVDSQEASVKERIREILADNKDKTGQLDALKEKLSLESQQLNRHVVSHEQSVVRIRSLEEEKCLLESRLHKTENELKTLEISREGLRRDKNTFMSFLERLARALNMDEISQEIGVDLHTESLLVRAEQLARLESDKLVDKLLYGYSGSLPKIKRERSFPDLKETAVVYQLQRRVRTLREQLQRKDLHLDLLRRKLALQEDNAKVRGILQNERDEASMRGNKLAKQVDRLTMQLADAKAQCRDLNSQLAEAADYKITALERARKIEDLQKRLVESEMLRTKYNRKVSLLKDQVRVTGETVEQERNISGHSMQLLREELARVKDNLADCTRRENQLQIFKESIAKILGCSSALPDYELVSRLQKLVDAHHEFTLVSRRYDDPMLRLTSRSPTGGSRCTRTPDRSIRYDDSGYVDAPDIDDTDDDIYAKRRPI